MSKCDLSQSSDQNMDESIFTTTGIYIIVGASYVNLISLFAQLAKANVCRFLTTRHTHTKRTESSSSQPTFPLVRSM